MKKTASVFALFLSLLIMTQAHAFELTEQLVKQLVERVDKAVEALDAEAIGKEFSDDVAIVLNLDIQGQKSVIKQSKEDYIDTLKQSWGQNDDYQYQRSNMLITITDNTALVTADITESMTVQGKKLSVTTKEEATIEVLNGKPLVTKVIGYSHM